MTMKKILLNVRIEVTVELEGGRPDPDDLAEQLTQAFTDTIQEVSVDGVCANANDDKDDVEFFTADISVAACTIVGRKEWNAIRKIEGNGSAFGDEGDGS